MGEGGPPGRGEMVVALDEATRSMGLPLRRRLTVFTGALGVALCNHLEQDMMVAALTSIEEVDGRPATVRTLVSSGTIKKVKAHLKLDRES